MEREAGVVIAGRYRLVEKLGSGGMGSVWLAQDLSLDSHCAVKLIDPEKSRSEEVRKRFVREAKAAAQLRGPHVVDVFDRGESEGILYIAMEYLDGEDLCTRLGRVGVLDIEKTYRIIAHVARALSSAHALGIVHRDLKPENIFLVQSYDEEIAKVVDFGIAQHAQYHIEDRATREGSFLGTPYYVSPEQARGRPTDHRSDLWSLAVIAYQCLTGIPPFDSESLGDLMGLILYEPIPKITETNPGLPPALEEWWTRATQRDRELRFQSARDMADQLGRALGVKTVVTVPTMPPRRPSSYPDDGEYRLMSGMVPPLRSPIELVQESARIEEAMKASTLSAAVEPRVDPLRLTDVAVTRTPPSLHQVQKGVEWAFQQLKAFPRRSLVMIAVAAGVFLGALITVVISSRAQPATAFAPEPTAPMPVRPAAAAASGTSAALAAAPLTGAGGLSAAPPEITPVSATAIPILPTAENPVKRVPSPQTGRRRSPPPQADNPYGI